MKRLVIAGVLVSAASVSSLGQAAATPLSYTYRGTISSGLDADGLFGAAGADLAGKTIEIVETFDVAKAYGTSSQPNWSYTYGGSGYGTAGFASSTVRIGSASPLAIDGTYAGLYATAGYGSSYVESATGSSNGSGFSGSYAYTSIWSSAPSLTAGSEPGTVSFDGLTSRAGGSFAAISYAGDIEAWSFSSVTHASANFDLQSLTIASVSAVPLPASAPMFGAALLGLAALGCGLRRRTAVTA